ncbi:YIP1 family protein [Pedobacter sp. UC225_65]|uniref:YIP1 family protein n=1 Tax=Pedobacter sp. UC225_65 TaxID=3350173 RepID=UPI00366CBC3A
MNHLNINLNPIYNILFAPKVAFKDIFDRKDKHLFILIIVGCIWHTFNNATNYNSNARLWTSLIVSILISCLIGWVFLLAYSAVISWLAKLNGGSGSVRSTFTVMAWSFFPGFIGILLYLLVISIFGSDVIKNSTAIGYLDVIRSILLIINGLLNIWSLFILVTGIIYVHQISVWRAILVIAIPFVAMLLIFSLLTLI